MDHPRGDRWHGPGNGDRHHWPATGTGRHARRRRWAGLLLTAGLVVLCAGMLTGEGVLIAAGLIMMAVAVQLLSGGAASHRRRWRSL